MSSPTRFCTCEHCFSILSGITTFPSSPFGSSVGSNELTATMALPSALNDLGESLSATDVMDKLSELEVQLNTISRNLAVQTDQMLALQTRVDNVADEVDAFKQLTAKAFEDLSTMVSLLQGEMRNLGDSADVDRQHAAKQREPHSNVAAHKQHRATTDDDPSRRIGLLVVSPMNTAVLMKIERPGKKTMLCIPGGYQRNGEQPRDAVVRTMSAIFGTWPSCLSQDRIEHPISVNKASYYVMNVADSEFKTVVNTWINVLKDKGQAITLRMERLTDLCDESTSGIPNPELAYISHRVLHPDGVCSYNEDWGNESEVSAVYAFVGKTSDQERAAPANGSSSQSSRRKKIGCTCAYCAKEVESIPINKAIPKKLSRKKLSQK